MKGSRTCRVRVTRAVYRPSLKLRSGTRFTQHLGTSPYEGNLDVRSRLKAPAYDKKPNPHGCSANVTLSYAIRDMQP